jgi:hypothetical protein
MLETFINVINKTGVRHYLIIRKGGLNSGQKSIIPFARIPGRARTEGPGS